MKKIINWVKSLFVKTDKWPTTEVPKEEWNPKNVNLSDYNYDNGNFTPKKSVLEKQKRSRLEVRRAYKPPKTRAQRRVESYADDGVSRPRQEARRDTQKDSGIGDAILLGAALLAASSSSRASEVSTVVGPPAVGLILQVPIVAPRIVILALVALLLTSCPSVHIQIKTQCTHQDFENFKCWTYPRIKREKH
jgi:hypothetical protein